MREDGAVGRRAVSAARARRRSETTPVLVRALQINRREIEDRAAPRRRRTRRRPSRTRRREYRSRSRDSSLRTSDSNRRGNPPRRNQTSTDSLRVAGRRSAKIFSSRKTSPQASATHRAAGIGTPQARWRERHQSGRASTVLAKRSLPHSGIHVTRSIASFAGARRGSIFRNHCGVARKRIASRQRQQWG